MPQPDLPADAAAADNPYTSPAAALPASSDPAPWWMSGRLLVVIATILWSSNGLFAKATIFHSWPQDERGLILAFWRALFAGLFLAPFVRKPRFRLAMLPLWAAFTAMSFTFLTSMTLTTAANAIWLQNTAPLWVFLVGTCLLRQPVHRRDLVTLVFGMAGAGLILGFEMQSEGTAQQKLGVLLGLASGFCFGMVVLCLQRMRDEDSAWIVTANHLVAAAIIGVFALPGAPLPNALQTVVLVCFGALQMGLPYFLFGLAVRKISSQEAAGLCLLEPILSPVWVWLAWGEPPAWWTVAGAALILVGLAARYVPLGTTEAEATPA